MGRWFWAVLFCLGAAVLFTGCTREYHRKDIESCLDEEYGLTRFRV